MKTMPPSARGARLTTPQLSRRLWLQGAAGGGAALVSVSLLDLLAQDPRLLGAARSMSAMTGVELPEKWLEPATSLVGVILDYSKVLRKLDLGELEPATFFVAR
jgi:hypothetical protein